MKYPVMNQMVKELEAANIPCFGRFYDHKYVKLVFLVRTTDTFDKFMKITEKYRDQLACEKYRGWDITYNADCAPFRSALRVVRAKRA